MGHLEEAAQTYMEHFKDSISYSLRSIKATFYFFVHAISPDTFTKKGSDEIFELNDVLKEKLKKPPPREIVELN